MAGNEVGGTYDSVEIDSSGTFKYVLIELFFNDGTSKLLVRGHSWGSYHDDIYQETLKQAMNDGLDTECLGGGRINHDASKEDIFVYGYSMGFGRADHSKIASIEKEYNRKLEGQTMSQASERVMPPSKVMIKEANTQLMMMFERISTLENQLVAKTAALNEANSHFTGSGEAVKMLEKRIKELEEQSMEKDKLHNAQLVSYQQQCQNQLNVMKEQCKLQMSELDRSLETYRAESEAKLAKYEQAEVAWGVAKTSYEGVIARSETLIAELNESAETYKSEAQAEIGQYREAELTWAADKTAYEATISRLENVVHTLGDDIEVIRQSNCCLTEHNELVEQENLRLREELSNKDKKLSVLLSTETSLLTLVALISDIKSSVCGKVPESQLSLTQDEPAGEVAPEVVPEVVAEVDTPVTSDVAEEESTAVDAAAEVVEGETVTEVVEIPGEANAECAEQGAEETQVVQDLNTREEVETVAEDTDIAEEGEVVVTEGDGVTTDKDSADEVVNSEDGQYDQLSSQTPDIAPEESPSPESAGEDGAAEETAEISSAVEETPAVIELPESSPDTTDNGADTTDNRPDTTDNRVDTTAAGPTAADTYEVVSETTPDSVEAAESTTSQQFDMLSDESLGQEEGGHGVAGAGSMSGSSYVNVASCCEEVESYQEISSVQGSSVNTSPVTTPTQDGAEEETVVMETDAEVVSNTEVVMETDVEVVSNTVDGHVQEDCVASVDEQAPDLAPSEPSPGTIEPEPETTKSVPEPTEPAQEATKAVPDPTEPAAETPSEDTAVEEACLVKEKEEKVEIIPECCTGEKIQPSAEEVGQVAAGAEKIQPDQEQDISPDESVEQPAVSAGEPSATPQQPVKTGGYKFNNPSVVPGSIIRTPERPCATMQSCLYDGEMVGNAEI